MAASAGCCERNAGSGTLRVGTAAARTAPELRRCARQQGACQPTPYATEWRHHASPAGAEPLRNAGAPRYATGTAATVAATRWQLAGCSCRHVNVRIIASQRGKA